MPGPLFSKMIAARFPDGRKTALQKLPHVVHAVVTCRQQNDTKARLEARNGDDHNLVRIVAIRIDKALAVNIERSLAKRLIEIIEDLLDRKGKRSDRRGDWSPEARVSAEACSPAGP